MLQAEPAAEALPAPRAAAPPRPASTPTPREPVSERQIGSADALLPVASPTGNPDTTNYAVGADDTVVVQAAETLGHLADWSRVGVRRLQVLNRLHSNSAVTQGRKIRLDLSKVSPAEFVASRRDYHRKLQDAYFAAHRIAGTETYAIKRGDSLWTLLQQHADLPIWLVAQYNPDVNLNDMRPGTAITLPLVVGINRE
jgi:membrane-bound lytic murein transglycosylase D